MRRSVIYSLFLLLLVITSCHPFKTLEQQKVRANINLPKSKQVAENAPKELVYSRPEDLVFVRQDGAVVPLSITAEWDSLYMENISTVQTEEVVIVAADKRNVPERNGMISLDFVVSIPQELQHKNRLLYIQPIIERNLVKDSLQELRFTGREVRRLQEKEYEGYQRYLDRIIPDTADFYRTFVKYQKYENYLQSLQIKKNQLQQHWEALNELKEYADPLFTRYDYFNKRSLANDSLLKIAYHARAAQKISGLRRLYEKREADTIVWANPFLLKRYTFFNEKAEYSDVMLKQRYAARYSRVLAGWDKDSLWRVERFYNKTSTAAKKPVQWDLYLQRFLFFQDKTYKMRLFQVERDTTWRRQEVARDTLAFERTMGHWSVSHDRKLLKQKYEAAYRRQRSSLPMYQYFRELPDSFTIRKRQMGNWRESLVGEVTGYYEKQYQTLHHLFPMYHYQREITGVGEFTRRYIDKQARIEKQIAQIDAVDSAEVMKTFYDTRKMNSNEKRKLGKADYFKKNVRFPYNADCMLDSVTLAAGRVNYHYKKEVMADENSTRIKLFLGGQVVDPMGRRYELPTSDTLTFLVSSMTYFVQKRVRYLQKTIYRDAEVNFSVNIDFPVGKSNYVDTLRNNRQELKKIKTQTLAMMTDPSYVIDSLLLTANSSPEGAWARNELLARDRAMVVKDLLQKELVAINDSLGISSSIFVDDQGKQHVVEAGDESLKVMNKIHVGWLAEDWATLTELIRKDEQLKKKDEILNMIEKEKNPDRRESQLRKYESDYAYIRNTLYPLMRSVTFSFRLHRRGMKAEKMLTNIPDTIYAKGLEYLEKRNYKKALDLLRSYEDINTAVVYISLGYNEAAYRILTLEQESAHAKYMKAIVACRLGKEKEAVVDLLRACELQPKLKFRGNLDPELSILIKKYGLFNEDF